MKWYTEEGCVKDLVFELSVMLLSLNELRNGQIEAYYHMSDQDIWVFTIGFDYRKLYLQKSFPPKYPVTIFMRYVRNSRVLGRNTVNLFFVAMFLPDFIEGIGGEGVIRRLREKWVTDEDMVIMGEEHIREVGDMTVYRELEPRLKKINASKVSNAYMWTWDTLKDVSIGTIVDVTDRTRSQVIKQAKKEILKARKLQDVMTEIYRVELGGEAPVIEKNHLTKYRIGDWIIAYFRGV